MLDRIKGEIVFICDGCDDALEADTGDFSDARDFLSDAGWRTSKVDDQWVHHCPSCKPKRVGLFG